MNYKPKMNHHYPHSKLKKDNSVFAKAPCEICKKIFRVRHIILFKGKYLCTDCRLALNKIQESAIHIGREYISLETALKREYEVKTYFHKNQNGTSVASSSINVPSCFMNKKVKLVLIEEDTAK